MPVRRSFVIVLMRLHQGKGKCGFCCCQIVLVMNLSDVHIPLLIARQAASGNLRNYSLTMSIFGARLVRLLHVARWRIDGAK